MRSWGGGFGWRTREGRSARGSLIRKSDGGVGGESGGGDFAQGRW